MKRSSLKYRFFIFSSILVFMLVLILGATAYLTARYQIKRQVEQEVITIMKYAQDHINTLHDLVQKKVNSDLQVARSIMKTEGRVVLERNPIPFRITNQITKKEKQTLIPTMRIGGRTVARNYQIVDRVQSLVGGTATIFQVIPEGLLRISTNVLKLDGNRAVGTYIPTDSPVYKTVMEKKTFYGRAFVVNAWYITAYEPIQDVAGNVIGVLYVGVKEKDYHDRVLDRLAEIRLGKSGYLAVVDSSGNYVLSFKRQRDGENILEAQSSDGRYIIKEMIELARNAKKGEIPRYEYPWKNKGEIFSRDKIAYISYFSEWNWLIATTFYKDEVYGAIDSFLQISVITLVVVMLLGGGLSFYFSGSILRPIMRVSNFMTQMAGGDLSVEVDEQYINRHDEIGSMAANTKNLTVRIREIVGNMKKSSESLNRNSEDVARSITTFSANMQEQAASLEEISASVEELAAGMDSIYNNAKVQKGSSHLLSIDILNQIEAFRDVGSRVEETNHLTDTIAGLVKDGEKSLKELKVSMSSLVSSSDKMTGITGIITGISEQINLLSLNAAIEAARAGDSGRGFAVVADEISKLADQTTSSIKEIVSLLEINHKEINAGNVNMDRTVNIMEQIIHGVETISRMMNEVSDKMNAQMDINQNVTKSTEELKISSSEIQNSTEQQKVATDEITLSIQSINELIQKITAEFENLTQKTDDLNSISKNLKSSVDFFRLD